MCTTRTIQAVRPFQNPHNKSAHHTMNLLVRDRRTRSATPYSPLSGSNVDPDPHSTLTQIGHFRARSMPFAICLGGTRPRRRVMHAMPLVQSLRFIDKELP